MVRVSTVSSRSRQNSPSRRTSTKAHRLELAHSHLHSRCRGRVRAPHGRRRLPHHQRARHGGGRRSAVSPAIMSIRLSPGLAAERLQVHVDAGQRRPRRKRHHVPIVEADDRDVARHREPRSRNASAAPRAIWSLPQKIASGRGAPPRTAWRRPRGPRPPTRRPRDRIRRCSASPPARKRRQIAAPAQPHRLEMLRPGDMGDALAAELRQMLDREHCAALIVGEQRQRAGSSAWLEDVDDRQAVRAADRSAAACRRGAPSPPARRCACPAAGRDAGARAPDRRWRCT